MQAILEILCALRCKVTFVADNLEYRQPYVGELQRRGVEVLFQPVRRFDRGAARRARRRVRRRRDVAALHRRQAHRRGARVRARTRSSCSTPSTCTSCARSGWRSSKAAPSAKAAARAQARRGAGADPQGRRHARRQPGRAGAARASSLPDARVMVLSNIHELCARRQAVRRARGPAVHRRLPASAEHRRGALVRARDPAARARSGCRASGRRSSAARCPRRSRRSPRTTSSSPATCPTSRRISRGARISISPLRYGAGVKGKVNLAMSYGLPVVATPPSIEGMHLTPGEDVLVADDRGRLRRRDRPALRRRGAVGDARRGRPREHPPAFLARRRARRDHAADRRRRRAPRRALAGAAQAG